MVSYKLFKYGFVGCVLAASAGCRNTPPAQQESTAPRAHQDPDYPVSEAALLGMRDRQDTAAIRKHAWAVFAEITKPSVTSDPKSPPRWDTWTDETDLFSDHDVGSGTEHQRQRKIELPLEIVAAIRASKRNKQAALETAVAFFTDKTRSVGTETLFNEDAANHIRNEGMNDALTLKTRWNTFKNLNTPISERNVPALPSSAIVVKAAWRTVGPGPGQSFEVWDPPSPSAADCLDGCKRVITVRLADANQPCDNANPGSNVYWSSCFYNVPDPTETGYRLLLFGIHVITKETSDWTWSTFWWQADPDKGKFAAQRPDQSLLQGLWRNYVMDATLSMQTPQEASPKATSAQRRQHCQVTLSTTAKICFNPFIERKLFPNGPVSNCMTCHRLATYPALIPDSRGAPQRGYLSLDDPCFDRGEKVMKVDYLWSLSPVGEQTELGQFISTLTSQLALK